MKHLLLAAVLLLSGCSTFDIKTYDAGILVKIEVINHTSVVTTTSGRYRGIGATKGKLGEEVTVIKYYDGTRELWLKESKSYIVLRR